MKTLFVPLGLAVLLLAACGKKDEPQPNQPATTPPPAGAQPTTAPNQATPPPAAQPTQPQPSDQTTPPPSQ